MISTQHSFAAVKAFPESMTLKATQAGCVTIALSFAAFMVWGYTPDSCLQALGFTYYPSKEWAVLIPAWALVACASVVLAYEGFNMMGVPSLKRSSQAPFAVAASVGVQSQRGCCDIPLAEVNRLLYH